MLFSKNYVILQSEGVKNRAKNAVIHTFWPLKAHGIVRLKVDKIGAVHGLSKTDGKINHGKLDLL